MKSKQTQKTVFGHPGRLQIESRRLTLLILGSLLVFILAMLHDEIVQDMVARGVLAQKMVGPAEVIFGVILFACWSALTVGLVSFLTRVGHETDQESHTPKP